MDLENRQRVFELLEQKLEDIYMEENPDPVFYKRWYDYLKMVGAESIDHPMKDRRLVPLDEIQEEGSITIRDPMYSRVGILKLNKDLALKILALGLP